MRKIVFSPLFDTVTCYFSCGIWGFAWLNSTFSLTTLTAQELNVSTRFRYIYRTQKGNNAQGIVGECVSHCGICAKMKACAHTHLYKLTFSSHLCGGSWLWPDVLSWGFDASSCTLSETPGTPVLALTRHANTCIHMVACCLTLLGQQESLERQAMVALQDTIWHMLTPYSP